MYDDVCIGLAVEDIPPRTAGAIRVEGVLELADWTIPTGSPVLTVGATYWNSFDDFSKLTIETGDAAKREWIGNALSTTAMMVAKRFAVPRGFYPLP